MERWEGEGAEEDEAATANTSADSHSMDVADTSIGSGMDVDEVEAPVIVPDGHGSEKEDSDDEDDDASDVAMVPMADMLNARYGCENVSNLLQVFSRQFADKKSSGEAFP